MRVSKSQLITLIKSILNEDVQQYDNYGTTDDKSIIDKQLAQYKLLTAESIANVVNMKTKDVARKVDSIMYTLFPDDDDRMKAYKAFAVGVPPFIAGGLSLLANQSVRSVGGTLLKMLKPIMTFAGGGFLFYYIVNNRQSVESNLRTLAKINEGPIGKKHLKTTRNPSHYAGVGSDAKDFTYQEAVFIIASDLSIQMRSNRGKRLVDELVFDGIIDEGFRNDIFKAYYALREDNLNLERVKEAAKLGSQPHDDIVLSYIISIDPTGALGKLKTGSALWNSLA